MTQKRFRIRELGAHILPTDDCPGPATCNICSSNGYTHPPCFPPGSEPPPPPDCGNPKTCPNDSRLQCPTWYSNGVESFEDPQSLAVVKIQLRQALASIEVANR